MLNKSKRRILIVGGSGLIGSHITKKCEDLKINFLSTYFSKKKFSYQKKFDLNQNNNMPDIVQNDDIVIYCSAYANPNYVYKNKENSYKFNVTNTIKFFEQIKNKANKIFFLSSVEVFDGKKGDYKEHDIRKPLNFYGKTKYEVEDYIKNNLKNFCIIRTGWNIGMDPNDRCVIKLTYENLLKNDAKMANDNYFTITNVEDFANNLLKILFKIDDEILHLSSDQKISRTDLADYIISKSSHKLKMKYKSVKFSDIIFEEPRSRLNDLNNDLSKNKYKLNFSNPYKTLDKKIKILDNFFRST